MKTVYFTLVLSLMPLEVFSNSCLDMLAHSEMFQLKNTVAVGGVLIHSMKAVKIDNIILTRWVYLSPYDADNETISVGIAEDGLLYLLVANDKIDYGSNKAWLLSGEMKISEFIITESRLLLVKNESGKVFTVDNALVAEDIKRGSFNLKEFILGKRIPTSGYLRPLSREHGFELERLSLGLFQGNSAIYDEGDVLNYE